jgi:F-type H+-transporting ATPase subunit epsilon
MKLQLEIITPQRVVLSEQVDSVTIPAIDGEVTILPEHIPLFTRVVPGEIKYKEGKSEHFMAVQEGFLEVAGDRVNIITNYAVRSEEIEIAKVEAAKKRAEQNLADKKSDVDFSLAQAELQKSILELKVARRRRSAS